MLEMIAVVLSEPRLGQALPTKSIAESRRWERRPSTRICAVREGICFSLRLGRAKVGRLTRRLGPMSKFRFAAIAAIVAALPLASVDAFGDASDAELAYVDFVSAPP